MSHDLCCDVLLLQRWCHATCVARTPPPALVSHDLCCDILLLQRWCHATCVATYSSSSVGVTRLVLQVLLQRWCHATCVATYSSSVGVTRLVLHVLLLQRWCHATCVARTPPPALVSHVLCCDILLLQRWCHATCVARTPPALVSRDLCCHVLLQRWCHTTCVARTPPPALVSHDLCCTYSSSGVGVTRLVLRHTPPPALVSRDLCCTYSSSSVGVTRLVLHVLLLRRWCHATCVATYHFSHVKSKRLLPLVGNPWHETQAIKQLLVFTVTHSSLSKTLRAAKQRTRARRSQTQLIQRDSIKKRTDAHLIPLGKNIKNACSMSVCRNRCNIYTDSFTNNTSI